MIPKRIIQIWMGNNPPDIITFLMNSTKSMYESLGYEYLLITNPEPYLSNDYLGHKKPILAHELRKHWNRLQTETKRPVALQSDLIKLLAILTHGGIIIDSDMLPIQPLPERLLEANHLFSYVNPHWLVGEHLIGSVQNDYHITGIAMSYLKTRIVHGLATINLSHWVPQFGLLDQCIPHHHTISHWRNAKEEERYMLYPDSYFSHIWYREYNYDIEKLKKLQHVACH